MSLTSELRIKLSASQTKTYDKASPRFSPVLEKIISLSSGVAADMADLLYVDDFSIAASSTGNYDLNASLTDALGTSIVAVELVGIVVFADSTNTNNVLVGGAGSNPVPFLADTTDKVPVKPGGAFVLVAPNAAGICTITASTGDILGMANSSSGSAVTGTIGLLMRTA